MGLSGILTIGGTILGTSRDKPHKMPVGDRIMDMTDVMIDVFKKNTILGHVQRGGTPTAADRLLATRLGTACYRIYPERPLRSNDCNEESSSGRNSAGKNNWTSEMGSGRSFMDRKCPVGRNQFWGLNVFNDLIIGNQLSDSLHRPVQFPPLYEKYQPDRIALSLDF